MAKIVIALGGNALGNTPAEQQELVRNTSKPIADLIEAGHDIVIAHGNGPQIGMINNGLAAAAQAGAIKSDMPFPECGAMSQGYIGYHLQNALGNELAARGISKPVVTVITQVEVDPEDPAFSNPTKPIGMFYDKDTAERMMAESGFPMKEDSGRGFRRVVPSPKPVNVVEKDVIKTLVDSGAVVIAVGGGGIPVIKDNGSYKGVFAVIDKDFASAKLAELLDADRLVILTAVEKVAVNYNTSNVAWLDMLTPGVARRYIAEKQFGEGSMLPKVEAALAFAESKRGRTTLITKLESAADGIAGKTGTRIHM